MTDLTEPFRDFVTRHVVQPDLGRAGSNQSRQNRRRPGGNQEAGTQRLPAVRRVDRLPAVNRR